MSNTRLLLTLKDGRRINGRIQSNADGTQVIISDEGMSDLTIKLDDIVSFTGLKSAFWSRFKASIDIGVSFTKANNLKQFSGRSAVGYLADRWQLDANFNTLNSKSNAGTRSVTNEVASFPVLDRVIIGKNSGFYSTITRPKNATLDFNLIIQFRRTCSESQNRYHLFVSHV